MTAPSGTPLAPFSRQVVLRRLVLFPFLKLGVVLVALFVGGMLATTAASWYFAKRLERTEVRYEDLLAKCPRTEVSASARRLEELAVPLGLEIATAGRPGRARPSKDAITALKPVYDALTTHLEHALMRADDDLAPLPGAVEVFLEAHREQLLACRRHVLASNDLVWEWNPEKVLDGAAPGLVGMIKLQKLFLAQAIDASRRGDREEMLACLDAIHVLVTAALRRPETISLLIAAQADKHLHFAVRRLPGVPKEWTSRLRTFQPRPRLIQSLRFETATGWAVGKYDLQSIGVARPFSWVLGPYFRAGAYEHTERMLRLVDAHAAVTPCELTVARLRGMWRNDRPRWNVFSKNAWQSLEGSVANITRRELDQELTDLVLSVRNGEAVAPCTPSAACNGAAWLFESAPGGGFSIRLDRPLEVWPTSSNFWPLPLRFEGKLRP